VWHYSRQNKGWAIYSESISSPCLSARVARWYTLKPKSPIWVNFEGLGMKMVGIFYRHVEYITAIWYILLSFRNLAAVWYISHRFGILYQEKSGSPDCQPQSWSKVTALKQMFRKIEL
jgi:hypothetical protein